MLKTFMHLSFNSPAPGYPGWLEQYSMFVMDLTTFFCLGGLGVYQDLQGIAPQTQQLGFFLEDLCRELQKVEVTWYTIAVNHPISFTGCNTKNNEPL